MRFQKILVFVSLVVAALCLVHAWVFCSGLFAQLTRYKDVAGNGFDVDKANEIYNLTQNFSNLFQILSIVFILAAVLMLVMGCHSRRKYYITNYIAVGIFVAFALVFAILLIINLASISTALANFELKEFGEYYNSLHIESSWGKFTDKSWTLAVGYALFAIVLVTAIVNVLNVVWKVMLMKGEKKLLSQANPETVETVQEAV